MQNRRKLQTIPCLRLEPWQTMHSTSKSQSPTMPSPTHVTCRSSPASSGIHVRNIQKHHMAELTKGRQNNWSLVKNHNLMLHDQISASTSRQAEWWLILVQSKYFSPLMGHSLCQCLPSKQSTLHSNTRGSSFVFALFLTLSYVSEGANRWSQVRCRRYTVGKEYNTTTRQGYHMMIIPYDQAWDWHPPKLQQKTTWSLIFDSAPRGSNMASSTTRLKIHRQNSCIGTTVLAIFPFHV
jgi:hypothetical protein